MPITRFQVSPPVEVKEGQLVFHVDFRRKFDADELEILRTNYKNGRIKHNPDIHLQMALVDQFIYELQGAYDDLGMDGDFTVLSLDSTVELDPDKVT